jgi:hypothetical protein
MSTTEDLSSGASGRKVQPAPGLWIYILEGCSSTRSRAIRRGCAMSVTPGSSLAGVVHAVRNVCSGKAAELTTRLVEKGQAAHRAGRVSAVGAADCRPGLSARQKGYRS